MADREQLKEQIKYETELLRAVLLISVATIGGTVSLLLGDLSPLRFLLFVLGIAVTLALMIIGWRQDRRIRALINQIGAVR
jgi:phosphoglycerol transferase MdoB-like AlkP superfamily enzyme